MEPMSDQVDRNREKNTSYTSYREDGSFMISGSPVFTVLDFWRYCYGDLAGQSPVIAEFLVAKALRIEKAENVTYGTPYDDMSYRGMRVEVKSTEYVHAWNKKGFQKRSIRGSVSPDSKMLQKTFCFNALWYHPEQLH